MWTVYTVYNVSLKSWDRRRRRAERYWYYARTRNGIRLTHDAVAKLRTEYGIPFEEFVFD